MKLSAFVLFAAFALVLGMYACNEDMGGDPDSPRGDGRYRPVLARGDGHMNYLIARSMALDGDWVFDNDLARFGDPWNEPRTKTGRKSIVHPIGTPLVWTPLIWVAQGGAVVANAAGANIPTHGYTEWHQRFVFFSSVVFACFAAWFGRRVAARVIGGAWAPTYAAVAVLLGTSLLYYATYMPAYAHAIDAGACAAVLGYWALSIGRRDLRRTLILGALLGASMLVRVQEVALGVVVALEVLLQAIPAMRARRWGEVLRWVGFGAGVLGVALVVFIPQLVEWYVVFGSISSLPQGERFMRLEAPMIAELLWSPRNGWLSTHPIAYAGVLGLFVVPRKARLVAGGFLVAIAVQVYFNSCVYDWWSGSSFGQRRMCNVTLPLVVGLAALVWRCNTLARRVPIAARHVVALVVLVPFVAYNIDRAYALRGGKPAPAELSPSCCGNVPAPVRGVAQAVYDSVGNPFQFPASWIFALRHGVSVRRWDHVVGTYPMFPPSHQLDDASLPRHRATIPLGTRASDPLIVRGLSAPVTGGPRPFRWTIAPVATVFVPNNFPYGQRLTLMLGPGPARAATVRWNGDPVATVTLTDWTPVTIDLPDIGLHTNELSIEGLGVAVGDLTLTFLPVTR